MKNLFLVAGLAVLSGPAFAETPEQIRHLSGAGSDPAVDRIRFVDRAEFDPALRPYLERVPRFLPDWGVRLVFSPPPANSSPRTEAELAYLRELQAERTEEDVAAIRRQIRVAGMKLGPHEMGELLGKESPHPAWKVTIDAAQRDMEAIVFQLKQRFSWARPTHLDPALVPCIEVPGHPAYPSGHATQAHLLAYLLVELDPANAEAILRDARAIAHNREIAGVHYPSDSEFGARLARQIVDRLLEHEEFRGLVEAAKEERIAPDQ